MKRFSALVLLAVLLLLAALPGCTRTKPREIRDVRKFRFTYSCGMKSTDQVVYGLDVSALGATATVKPQGIEHDKYLTMEVDDAFVQQVEELLRANHVEKWYRFNKRARNIMDGIGFTLYLDQADGTKVDAVGYMRWPENYGNVEGGLNSLFLGLWEAAGLKLPENY